MFLATFYGGLNTDSRFVEEKILETFKMKRYI